MKIDVLGCGSAFSLNYTTSAIRIIDDQQSQWLIDCGPTVPRALWNRKVDINAIDVIFFTHIHPDHCAGLAVLLNHWKSFGRVKPLQIYCQPEQQTVLVNQIALANWPYTGLTFPIEILASQPTWRWRGWQIQTAFAQHEIPSQAIRIEADNHALFYSGDGRPTDATQALMAGSTLAFQECASWLPLAADASHGDYPACMALCEKLALNLMVLYHCQDADRPAIAQACALHPHLLLSDDGAMFDLARPNRLQTAW